MESRAHWKALATGDITARDALLTENLSLVHHVARQLERKLSNELDHDELVSAGTLGLMAAMNSFDPERGLAFSTFAVPRIRGAVLDELRRQDHVPRSIRRKTRDIGTARSTLAAKLCRMPEDSEIAEALGVDVADFVEVGGRCRRCGAGANRSLGERSRRDAFVAPRSVAHGPRSGR